MKPELISIIIPAYNEKPTIEKMVRQFKDLQYPHEIIVADNLSGDGTAEAAMAAGARIAQMKSPAERGVSRARNNGARAANGDLLLFMDSDTTVMGDINDFFDKAADCFAKNPRLTGLTVRWEVDPKEATASDRIVMRLMNIWYLFLNNVCNGGLAAGKFIMVTAETFDKLNGFREDLHVGEDVEFFGRVAKAGRVRLAWKLLVVNSGRRFHEVGAWRTLFHWIKNALTVWIFKKSDTKWDPVR